MDYQRTGTFHQSHTITGHSIYSVTGVLAVYRHIKHPKLTLCMMGQKNGYTQYLNFLEFKVLKVGWAIRIFRTENPKV